MKVPEDGLVRFEQRVEDFKLAAERLAGQLTGRDKVRIEAEERPASSKELEEMIVERLPRTDLPALLIEVDRWIGFSEAFTHAGGRASRKPDLPIIYATQYEISAIRLFIGSTESRARSKSGACSKGNSVKNFSSIDGTTCCAWPDRSNSDG